MKSLIVATLALTALSAPAFAETYWGYCNAALRSPGSGSTNVNCAKLHAFFTSGYSAFSDNSSCHTACGNSARDCGPSDTCGTLCDSCI
jgi:hypothetical protein